VNIGGTPAIARDGTVYVLTRYPSPQLVGLDPRDGGVRSTTPVNDSRGSLTIGPDGTVYFSGVSSDVNAVSPPATPVFSVAFGGGAGVDFAQPSVGADGTVYIGADTGQLRAYLPDGGVRWTLDAAPNLDTSGGEPIPIAPDGTLRAYSYGSDSHVYSITPQGTVSWATQVGPGVVGLAVADDGTTITGADELMWVVGPDGDAGARSWNACARAMIGADGTIYTGCAGTLYALDPTGRTMLWSYAYQGNINHAPVIGYDRTIYFTVASYDATHSAVYAIH
jgi:hypothetical protein